MSEGKGTTGRTILLSLVVFLSLIVLIAVAALVFTGRDDSTDSATAPATSTSRSTSTSTTTTTSTTSTPETTHTRPTGEPGTVTYQFTGDGEVIGASYRSGTDMRVVVITGTPWQQKTTVQNRRAELTGIVVRGRITCTIMQGEELLASSTSGGGPITCRAKLPR